METHEEVKAATNIEVTSEEKEASQKSSLYSPPKSTSEHLPQETKAASIHATTAQEGALMTNEQSKEAAKVQEVTSKVQEAIDEGSETDMSLSFFDQLSQRETSTTYDQIKGAAADCALTTELQKDSHDNKKISNSRVWKGSLGDNETDESLSISWLHSEKKEVDNIYATLAERGQHMSNVQKKAVTAMKIKEDKANLSGSDKSLSWSTFKSLSEIKEDFHMTTHQRQKSMTYSQIKAAEPIVKTEGGQDSHDDNDKPEPWSTSESISEIKEDCHMTIHQIQKFMTHFSQIKETSTVCAVAPERQKTSHGDSEMDIPRSISEPLSEKKKDSHISIAQRPKQTTHSQRKEVSADYAVKPVIQKTSHGDSEMDISMCIPESLSEKKEIDSICDTSTKARQQMANEQVKVPEPIVKIEASRDSHGDDDKAESQSISEPLSEKKEHDHITIAQSPKPTTHSKIQDALPDHPVKPEIQKASHGYSKMDRPLTLWRMPVIPAIGKEWEEYHCQSKANQRKQSEFQKLIHDTLSKKKEDDNVRGTTTNARQQRSNIQVKVPEPIVKIEASRDSHGDDDKAESQELRRMPVIPPIGRQWEDYHCESKANQRQQSEFQKIIHDTLSKKKEDDNVRGTTTNARQQMSNIQVKVPEPIVKIEASRDSHGDDDKAESQELRHMPVIPPIGRQWEDYHCESKANQRQQSEFQKIIHDTLSKKKEDDNVRGTTTNARQQMSNIQVKVPEPIVKIEASRDSHGDDDKAESQELRHMPVIPPIGRQWEDYHCESKANQRQQSEFQKIIHDTLSKKKEDDNVRGTTTNARQQMSNIQVKVPEPIVKIEASRDSHGDDDKAESQELRHMPVIPPIGRQWEDYHCESKANQRQQSEFQKIIHDTLSKKKEDDNVRGTTTNARQQMSNIQVKEAEPTVKREGSRDSHGDGDKAESRNISEPLSNKKEDVHMTVAPRSKHMTHSQIKAAESIVKIEGGRKSHGDGDKAESRSISEPLSKTKGDGHITIAQRPKHTTHSQSKEASEDHTVKPEIQKVSHGNSEMDIPKHIPESPSEVKEADNLHGTTTEARQRPANVQIKAAEPIMKIEGSRNSHGDSDKAESQQRISESLSKKKEVDNLQDTTTKARQGMSNVQIKAAEPVVKIEGGRDNHSDSYKAESRSISEPHSSKKEDGHINVAQRPKHPTHSQIKEPSADDTAKPEIQKTSHRDSKMDLLMQRIPESLPEKKEVDNVPGTTTKAGQRMANVQIKAAEPIMKVEGSRDSHGDSDKAESRSISEPLSKKKEDGPISITQRKQTTHSKIKEASEVHTVTPEIQKASRGDSEMDIPMQRISESLSEKKEVDNLQDTTTKARQRNSNVQIKAAEPVVNIEGGHDSHSDSYKAESRSISEPRSNKKEDGHKTIAKRPKHTKHSQIKETSADHTAKPEIKKASHRDSKMGLLTPMPESLSEKKDVDNLQDTTTKARQQISKVQIKAAEPVVNIEGGHDSHSNSYKAESRQSISEPHSSKKEDGHKTIAQRPKHGKHSRIKEASADHTAKPEIQKASHRDSKMDLLKQHMPESLSEKKEVDNLQDATTKARQQMSKVQIKAAEPVVKIEGDRDSHTDSYKTESQQSISEPHSSKKEDGHKTIAKRPKHAKHSQIKEASADHTAEPEIQEASHRDSKMDLLTHMSESLSEKKEVDNLQDTTTKARQQMSKVQIKATEPVLKIESGRDSHSDSYKAESQQSISEPHSSKKEDGHKTIAQQPEHAKHSQIKASADHSAKPEIKKASRRGRKMGLLTCMCRCVSGKKEVDNVQDTTTEARQQMSEVQIKAAEPVVKIESSRDSHSDSHKAESQQSISEPHSSKKEDGHKTIAQRQKHGTHSQIKEASADHTTKPEVQKASHRDSKMDLLTQHMSESHSEKKEVDNLQDTTTKTRQQMSKVQIKAAEPVVKIESSHNSHSDSYKAESQSISEPHSSKKEDGHKTIAQRQKHGTHSHTKEASRDHTTKPEIQKASHRDSKMDLLTQRIPESLSEKEEVDNICGTAIKARQQLANVQTKEAEPTVKIEVGQNSHGDSDKAESWQRIPESLPEKKEVDNVPGTTTKAGQQMANVQIKAAEPIMKVEGSRDSHGDSDKTESRSISEPLSKKKEDGPISISQRRKQTTLSKIKEALAVHTLTPEIQKASRGDSEMDIPMVEEKQKTHQSNEMDISEKTYYSNVSDTENDLTQQSQGKTSEKPQNLVQMKEHARLAFKQEAEQGKDVYMLSENMKKQLQKIEKKYEKEVKVRKQLEMSLRAQDVELKRWKKTKEIEDENIMLKKKLVEFEHSLKSTAHDLNEKIVGLEKKLQRYTDLLEEATKRSSNSKNEGIPHDTKHFYHKIEIINTTHEHKVSRLEHTTEKLKSKLFEMETQNCLATIKTEKYKTLDQEVRVRKAQKQSMCPVQFTMETDQRRSEPEDLRTANVNPRSSVESPNFNLARLKEQYLKKLQCNQNSSDRSSQKYPLTHLLNECNNRNTKEESETSSRLPKRPVQFSLGTDQRHSEPEDLRTANVNPRSSVESPNFNLAKPKEQYLKKLQCNQNSSDRSSQKYPLTHLLNECNNRNTKEESETSSRLPKRPVQFSLGTDQRHSEPEDLRTANVNPRSSVESPNFNLAKPKEQYLKKLQCNQNSSDRSSQKYPLTHLLNECNNRNTKEESETSSRLPK
uniref:protein MLP1-like n=1 Tax=Jaculus jaculus TaxID=51337 RepID=UPI001E1B18A0|nr:protein MLP1-like [Jaculus jaculus]